MVSGVVRGYRVRSCADGTMVGLPAHEIHCFLMVSKHVADDGCPVPALTASASWKHVRKQIMFKTWCLAPLASKTSSTSIPSRSSCAGSSHSRHLKYLTASVYSLPTRADPKRFGNTFFDTWPNCLCNLRMALRIFAYAILHDVRLA